jgi:hypothetical protein
MSRRIVGYEAIHRRLAVQRGKASTYRCPCGKPATGWAYRRGAPDERLGLVGGEMRPYSQDLNYYVPLCSSCHTRLDRSPSYRPPEQEVPYDPAELAGLISDRHGLVA